jgi:putative photosynthetic complex assembly protein
LSSLDERPIPITALVAGGLLIITTVLGVKLHIERDPPALRHESVSATLVKSRLLRFVDEGDGVSVYGGHVRVFDVQTGAELPQLRENDGFIRAVLNSLAFERSRRGITGSPDFELASWSDYRVTLTDRLTGAHVSLGEFGARNKAVFFRFLESPKAPS